MQRNVETSTQRMEELERRVLALEERASGARRRKRMNLEEDLIWHYGEYVDKTSAAKILGVTRATVYAMLADGRISGACAGRRVDVRSIARYISRPFDSEQERSRNGRKQAPVS